MVSKSHRSARASIAGVVLASQAWVPLLGGLAVGTLAQPAAAQTPTKPQSILLVAYAVTKAAYDKIIPLFVADWKKKTGQSVVIRTSYCGSGSQTRAVIDGLEADVVALAMASDITKLEKAGLVKPGWQNELPNQSVATNSTVATVAPAELPKPSAVSYIPRPPRRSSSTMASGR